MNTVLQLGPLAIAVDRLVAALAIWAFVAAVTVIGARSGRFGARTAWSAVAVGIVAARLGYVSAHWSIFRDDPVSILAIWQGGFSWRFGVAAAALVLVALIRDARAAGAALGVLGLLALVWGIGDSWTLRSQVRPLPDGIVIQKLNGQPLALDSLRGRPYVVNLWATWCPPCRRELPMLVNAARTSRVPILLVDQGEMPVRVAAFLVQEGISDRNVLIDPAGRLGQASTSVALPTTLFIDAQGRIRSSHFGEISRAALAAGIEDLERKPS